MALDHPLRIGDLSLGTGLLLAPMEDVSEPPFRLVCRQLGADMVYTEFVNAEGLLREDPHGPRRSSHKLDFADEERPIGIQIYGASELSMEEATRIATQREPDLIDINCGCWVSNVALRGAGAGLLRDLPQMRQVVRRVRGATHLPVTVKTRLGWDADDIVILDVARMLEANGVQALTVHCRTRKQGYTGEADWSWLPRIKEVSAIPLIANGDIATPEDVEAILGLGCDGVMIGRGAIRNPWIFDEIKHYLASGEHLAPASMEKRIELCIRHLKDYVAIREGGRGVAAFRKFYVHYLRGMPDSARFRVSLMAFSEVEPIVELLRQYKARLAGDALVERSA